MGVVIASASIPLKDLQGCHDYNVALQCPRRARHSGMPDPRMPGGGKVDDPATENLGESQNVEGGIEGSEEKYSTMYLTLTMCVFFIEFHFWYLSIAVAISYFHN